MAGYMNFLIPRESTEQLVEFFKKLSKANLGIRDIQVIFYYIFFINKFIVKFNNFRRSIFKCSGKC